MLESPKLWGLLMLEVQRPSHRGTHVTRTSISRSRTISWGLCTSDEAQGSEKQACSGHRHQEQLTMLGS